MRSRSDRLIRVIAFVLGALAGAAVFDFIYANQGSLNLDWLGLHFSGVPVWSVGVIPLLAGVALGYAYHFPARLFHQREHRRHAAMVAQLERDNQALRGHIGTPAADEPPALPPPPEETGTLEPARTPKVKATPMVASGENS